LNLGSGATENKFVRQTSTCTWKAYKGSNFCELEFESVSVNILDCGKTCIYHIDRMHRTRERGGGLPRNSDEVPITWNKNQGHRLKGQVEN